MTSKLCPKCGIEKEYSEFHNDKSRKDGKKCYCKSCRSILRKDHHSMNRDRDNINSSLYHKNNRKKRLAQQRLWVNKNRDKHRKSARRNQSLRRARIKNSFIGVSWTHEGVAIGSVGYCPYCNKFIGFKYDSSIMEIDHIVPLSRGGSHCLGNVEPICSSCNRSKGTMTKEEFTEKLLTEAAGSSIL